MRRSLALTSIALLALGASLAGGQPGRARAAPFTFLVTMSGAQVVPPSLQGISGVAHLVLETDTNQLRFTIVLLGASANDVAAAELRRAGLGANGPLVAQLAASGWTTATGALTLTSDQVADLYAGRLYVEVRSLSQGKAVSRGQVLPPALPGDQPLPLLPTVVPAANAGAPAQAQPVSPAARGGITPPATGDGGLREGF